MSYRINESPKIPDWFSIERYEAAREFTLDDWISELTLRFYLYLNASTWDEKEDDYSREDLLSQLENIVEDIGNNQPDIFKEKPKRMEAIIGDDSLEAQYYFVLNNTVSPLQYVNFFELASFFEIRHKLGEKYVAFKKKKNNTHRQMKPKELLHNDFYKPISDYNYSQDEEYLTVRTGAPDEVIIEDFKKWLAFYRENSTTEVRRRKYGEKDFSEWRNKKVLAYLDLDTWQTITEKN